MFPKHTKAMPCPDGASKAQKVTGTQAFQKQLEYDGLGRLTSVCEISSTLSGVGTCLQVTSQTGYWTKYTYDALNRLLSVTQNAQAAVGSRQARSFSYDMLGRLRSESNPEAGNGVTNGTVTYTYDVACATTSASPGDLTGKLDAAVTCPQFPFT
jgi:YD repeat-containing protein